MISDEKLAELQDKAKTRLSPDLESIIAELRASRKVVIEAQGLVNSKPWHDADVGGLEEALAELSLVTVRSDDPGNEPEKNFSELGNDPSLRSESESAT